MVSAIFVVPLGAGGPNLTMEQLGAAEGVTLADGTGWSVIGHVPQAPTCLCRITATEDVLDALAADGRYLYVEEVADA